MKEGNPKTRWESIAIGILIGAILLAFVYSLFLVFRKPERAAAVVPSPSPEPAGTNAGRSAHYYRQYRRSLAVHEMGGEWRQPPAEQKKAADYDLASPDVAPKIDPLDTGIVEPSQYTYTPPVQSRRAPRPEDEEDEKESTGWGWLADEIESGRRAKADRKPSSGAQQAEDKDAEQGDTDDDREDEEMSGEERRRDDELFFTDRSFSGDARDANERRDKNTGAVPFKEFGGRSNDDRRENRERMLSDEPGRSYDEFEQPEEAEFTSARDPFGSPQEADRGFGSNPVFPAESPFSDAAAGGFASPGASGEATADPAGIAASAPDRSGSIFNPVNTYESPAFGGARSESLFATESIFGSGHAFSGSEPSPVSSSIGAPDGPSAFDSSLKQDPNFKPPSAVNW